MAIFYHLQLRQKLALLGQQMHKGEIVELQGPQT